MYFTKIMKYTVGARCPWHGHLAPYAGQDAHLEKLYVFVIYSIYVHAL